MRARVWVVMGALAGSTTGCAKGGTSADGDDDAPIDAGPAIDSAVSGADAACQLTTWYRDVDQDQHGDPATTMSSCTQPAGMTAAGDDCDDSNPARHPGAPEVCDGVDTDCVANSEPCPSGCTPARRPAPDDAKLYLFCSSFSTWTSARTTCNVAGFQLVAIDSAAENAWLYGQLQARFGADDYHIGGNDAAAEGSWVWDGGVAFWAGGSGGGPVGGRYASWEPGEPNDDGTEDCAEMRGGGAWNDDSCGDGQRFACRK